MDLKKYLPPTREERELVTQWIRNMRKAMESTATTLQPWGNEEIERLKKMQQEGKSWVQIGLGLGRSDCAVRKKACALELCAKKSRPACARRESGKDNNPLIVYRDAQEKSREVD